MQDYYNVERPSTEPLDHGSDGYSKEKYAS